MIVDAHQHVCWHDRDTDGLVRDLDEQGIDQAWLLTWEIAPNEHNESHHRFLNPIHRRTDGTHAGIPLEDLLRARDREPDRFIVGYAPHPLMGDAAALFEAAHAIYDIRVCGEWKCRMVIDDPRCLNLFRTAGRLKCPVVLHLDVPYRTNTDGIPAYRSEWYGGTVENLARTLDACPETCFIGHAPGFWREISGDADGDADLYPSGPVTPGGRLHDMFDRHPNLFADLSAGSGLRALSRDPEHARRFIVQFSNRLLFARDNYGGELQTFLDTLNLPANVCERLYRNNAKGLLTS